MSSTVPSFPIMCLASAKETTTVNEFRDRNVVIDFWTTKCTRCPDALDRLDEMSKDPKYVNVSFVSICCDSLDGAREIIEKEDDPRWQGLSHYFMKHEDKEEVKEIFGFKTVPFYIFVNANGDITQFGSSKQVNFDDIPGTLLISENKENDQDTHTTKELYSEPMERVLVIDDLDF